jgi:hypothetical protein
MLKMTHLRPSSATDMPLQAAMSWIRLSEARTLRAVPLWTTAEKTCTQNVEKFGAAHVALSGRRWLIFEPVGDG